MLFTKGLQAGSETVRKLYLMGSLVALSLTVEEKEEWVLSSNRKDNGGFTVSKQDMEVRFRTLKGTNTLVLDRRLPYWYKKRVSSPSGLHLSLSRYLLGMVR